MLCDGAGAAQLRAIADGPFRVTLSATIPTVRERQDAAASVVTGMTAVGVFGATAAGRKRTRTATVEMNRNQAQGAGSEPC